ncbi:ATP-dependent Clp protease ATP-binding subunit ClpA [bacterium]|nr:ATP-dependent Clp protease ATP-binding subunit ClpA [bacterium]
MIKKELEVTINSIFHDAKVRRHEYLTVEHLLYAILHDTFGKEILTNCNGDFSRLKSSIEKFFDEKVPKLPQSKHGDPILTVGFQRIIQRAMLQVQASGKIEVDAGDLLAALYFEEDSFAVHFLEIEEISRMDILNYVSHGTSKIFDAPCDFNENVENEPSDELKKEAIQNPLSLFTICLNDKAQRGEIDPLIGRNTELQRTILTLIKRKKNNVVFVGEPGVGKTALVEGLALKIHQGAVPEVLKDTRIFMLDMGSILAGTKYRGDFESRLKATMKSLQKIPKVVLFIDEIHTLVGAGSTSGGAMDAANILKPLLNSGTFRCIGATTHEEYKNFFQKDRALSRRFQKIDLQEPSTKEAIRILKGLKASYEEFHGVKFTSKAIKAAVELASKFVNEKFLPDKAIDLIDEAGAKIRLKRSHERPKFIGVREIERTVAKIANIPSRCLSKSDLEGLSNLEIELKAVVFGQDDSIHSLVKAVKTARAGLVPAQKPIGSYLFIGPTGVGKTEIAKQLAAVLNVKFARFDMSEYMEKHSVSRLIGAPPGYIGFDQGGLLTDVIRKFPYCVLLLDEIEKAHPDIFSVLLQVMDGASLTDNSGRKADFRNVILIMTSNAGAIEMDKGYIGFGERLSGTFEKGMDAVKKLFNPEFRNRLDAIIPFNPLSPAIMLKVVDKFLLELEKILAQKHIRLIFSEEAKFWLSEKGFDPRQGARPLSRVIQRKIKEPLAEEILFGKLRNGGEVQISIDKSELNFSFSHLKNLETTFSRKS